MNRRTFHNSKEDRDTLFHEKDDVTIPILTSIPIPQPRSFQAVLMPALYGPEIIYLHKLGVPGRNIFAIERDPDIHAVLVRPTPSDFPHLVGIHTTSSPALLHQAIEHIPFQEINLVYLDLFGQPDMSHLKALIRLFRLYPLPPNAVLLLTYGRNRGDVFSCRLNSRLLSPTVGQAYIEAALRESGHRWHRELVTHAYVSENIHFQITEVHF